LCKCRGTNYERCGAGGGATATSVTTAYNADFTLFNWERALFVTSAPETSGYWQTIVEGVESAAQSTTTTIAYKYSPVSTEAGQILEQVKFLEWLDKLQSEPFKVINILIMSMAAAPEGADGVSQHDINLRFARVVYRLQYKVVISFVDQRVNKFADLDKHKTDPVQFPYLPNPNVVSLYAGDATGLTERTCDGFIDNWNARSDNPTDRGMSVCNGESPVVLVVSTEFPEDSNLKKKLTAVTQAFNKKTLRCSQGATTQIVQVSVGNDFASRPGSTKTAVETAIAAHQGHVAAVFVAIGEMIKPSIEAIKSAQDAPWTGVITIENIDDTDDDQKEYTSKPLGARGTQGVSDVGLQAFNGAKKFFDRCPGRDTTFENCETGLGPHGNNEDTVTTAHPPYKVSSVSAMKLSLSYWDATADCSGYPVSTDTFDYVSSQTCHQRSHATVKSRVRSMIFSGSTCTDAGTVYLYTDDNCNKPYQGLTRVKFTEGEVANYCLANRDASNKVVCTPRPGELTIHAAAPTTETKSSGRSDLEKGGIITGIVVAVLAAIAILISICGDNTKPTSTVRVRANGNGFGSGGSGFVGQSLTAESDTMRW